MYDSKGSDIVEMGWQRWLWGAASTVLVVAMLGIRSCTVYDRKLEAACISAGGVLTRINRGDGPRTCAKVTVEPIATPVSP